VKVKKVIDGIEKEVDETTEEFFPGYLEAIYHLYSITHKHGPVIIRMRTADRAARARLPSLTPIWRSAEFQEREIFDLYGVRFDGHPDLRRILMWDEFEDYPMRKDYCEPDDYEFEPTPHDDVLEKAKQHYSPRPQLDGAENITPRNEAETLKGYIVTTGNERANTRNSGAAAHDNDFKTRRRVNGSIDGAATSVDARRVSHERRARRRDCAQTQARLRISAS
jgi:NADH:ubiquinone oxidoreductase subunit C